MSFDTFENPAASMFSFTLSVKSDGYERNRHTRVFLCAASADDSGRQALDWAIEDLVQDGDELVVFRGIDQEDLGMHSRKLLLYQPSDQIYFVQTRIMILYVRKPENFCVASSRKLWISIITVKCVCSHLTHNIHTKTT